MGTRTQKSNRSGRGVITLNFPIEQGGPRLSEVKMMSYMLEVLDAPAISYCSQIRISSRDQNREIALIGIRHFAPGNRDRALYAYPGVCWPGFSVTVALLDLVGSAALVARTVTDCWVSNEAGAV